MADRRDFTLADFYGAVVLLISLWFVMWFLVTRRRFLFGSGGWPYALRLTVLIVLGIGGTAGLIYFIYTNVRQAPGPSYVGSSCDADIDLSEQYTLLGPLTLNGRVPAYTMRVTFTHDGDPGTNIVLPLFTNGTGSATRDLLVRRSALGSIVPGIYTVQIFSNSNPEFSVAQYNISPADTETQLLMTYDKAIGDVVILIKAGPATIPFRIPVTDFSLSATPLGSINNRAVVWGNNPEFDIKSRRFCQQAESILYNVF